MKFVGAVFLFVLFEDFLSQIFYFEVFEVFTGENFGVIDLIHFHCSEVEGANHVKDTQHVVDYTGFGECIVLYGVTLGPI